MSIEYVNKKNTSYDIAVSPIFEEITYQDPKKIFEPFSTKAWNLLIESSDGYRKAYGTNRYSYILLDPFDSYQYHFKNKKSRDPLSDLRLLASQYRLLTIKDLPPFQGGIAGYLSYDLAHVYYLIACRKINDLDYPEIGLGFYDLVCSFDHVLNKAYIFSSGFPEGDENKRIERALKRLAWFKEQMSSHDVIENSSTGTIGKPVIQSNFNKETYIEVVNKCKNYIKNGDIFEINLSQRFEAILPNNFNYYGLYQDLSLINPSPFAAYLNLGRYKIISASPERFINLNGRRVETRPIKGTRARSLNKLIDDANILELINSEKDIAENIMIVDLMRNDLSKVCDDNSVIVEKLCAHEVYPTVHHLVSVISGLLKEEYDMFDLLRATFPGGSITGAPKIRAMQIIAELEPHQRGPYCGNIVIIGFDGCFDSSILIRTYVVKDNKITFHAGGAITIDSSPLEEYEETLNKSFALQKALHKGT